MLAAAISRSRDAAALVKVIDIATETKHGAWQNLAVLEGIDAGLEGGGGRGGGGGGGGRGGGRGGGGAGMVSLPNEPVGSDRQLDDLTDGTGPAAKRVLARLTWPGKPDARRRSRAPYAGAAETIRAGAGGLQQPLRGLPSAGWAGTREDRADARELALRQRRRRRRRAHRARRKRRSGRIDAAARRGPVRRSNRVRADLHPPRVGTYCKRRVAGRGEGSTRHDRKPHSSVDRRRNLQTRRRARRTRRAGGKLGIVRSVRLQADPLKSG